MLVAVAAAAADFLAGITKVDDAYEIQRVKGVMWWYCGIYLALLGEVRLVCWLCMYVRAILPSEMI